MSDRRFDLEWIMPVEPGLMTHVALMDSSQQPPVVAVGHGADEADTLLDLWTTLTNRDGPDAAIERLSAPNRASVV